MHTIGSNSARRDAGAGAMSTSALAFAPRRQVILGAAAFLGLALTAGCTAPDTRRCNEMVASGQHGHRMKRVPCPSEAPAS
jgi:hypothetical protein